MDLEGIYRIPGDMGEVRRTKEALNQGTSSSSHQDLAVCRLCLLCRRHPCQYELTPHVFLSVSIVACFNHLLTVPGKKVSFENMNPHTQASMLKAFFKELTDPVFSAQLYPAWIAGAGFLTSMWLSTLPNSDSPILVYLQRHSTRIRRSW